MHHAGIFLKLLGENPPLSHVKTLGRQPSVPVVLLIIFCLLVIWGCSSGPKIDRPTTEVRGVVTLDGQPVEDAVVTFQPGQNKRGATGRTDKDGKFTMTTFQSGDGVVPGEYNVVIVKYEQYDAEESRGGNTPELKHLLPKKYANPGTSKLTASVSDEGPLTLDFSLQSR